MLLPPSPALTMLVLPHSSASQAATYYAAEVLKSKHHPTTDDIEIFHRVTMFHNVSFDATLKL